MKNPAQNPLGSPTGFPRPNTRIRELSGFASVCDPLAALFLSNGGSR